MFTIRKIRKIQVFSKVEISTADIDSLRKDPYVNGIKIVVSTNIANIIKQSPLEERGNQIERFFPNTGKTKKIHKFLNEHPQLFTDLIRIIHTHRRNDNSHGGWYIPEDKISEIQQAFIFRGRSADVGNSILDFIGVVIHNFAFIGFCSEQKSLLDIGSYDFSMIPEKQREKTIKKLIMSGLINNISGSDESNIDFPRIKERLFYFLEKIYGIYISDLEWINNIDRLADELNKLFKTGKGNDRKRAWKVIQAFHAWGDSINIEKRYAIAVEALAQVPKKLKKIGIDINPAEITEQRNHQGIPIYSTQYNYQGYLMEINWRAKKPNSMLKKSWEKEEYVNKDYVRDAIGLSFTYPDDIPKEMISELVKKGSLLFADYGYILEDKGELDSGMFDKIAKESKKRPLFKSQKPGKDPNIKNINQSGFTSFEYQKKQEAIGIELQYATKSSMEYKKREDLIYKIKGAIDAKMRGEQQASPQEIFDALTREIPEEFLQEISDPKTGEKLNINDYNSLINYLIKIRVLLPYFGGEGEKIMLLFSTEKHRVVFENKWNMKPLIQSINKEEYGEMVELINSLRQRH